MKKEPDQVEVRLVTDVPADAIRDLYVDAGWWENEWAANPEFMETLARDSALFAGAFIKNQMVGMGRALSDRKSDAYIQDVAVLKRCRGKGIGSRIIRVLVKGLQDLGVDWIGLIGKPGTGRFYKSLGFKEMKDHIPFKFEG